ncbi:hypothetical protein BESB_022500 [Besnoitia besnoiti]|uniref:Uncharacterized protein n=1 Tax=Besnoitia besnoiti TaxID=94643 RepID=A0A2A9LZD3_BESBE|nr:hypothetical protein BESB_022500 [Besnoitia besnoiti]PFH31758.1 hypothetical protein BESB_022500 [Besnoitia besnoiti]
MMKWYWPSKYMFQDVQMAQYFQMQAMRFAQRPAHASMTKLSSAMEECWRKRDAVRSLFQSIDERVFRENPTLQDLYGLYRTLCAENPLRFPVDPAMWRNPEFTWRHPDVQTGIGLSLSGDVRVRHPHGDKSPVASDCAKHLSDARQMSPSSADNEVSRLLFSQTEQSHYIRSICAAAPAVHGRKGSWLRDRLHSVSEGEADHEISGNERKSLRLDVPAAASGLPRDRMQQCLLALSSLPEAGLSSSDSERMQQPPVLRVDVGLGDPEPVQDAAAFKKKQERSLRALETALDHDDKLARYHGAHHRFFDPFFRRKRLSFLDRFARERIKGEKARQLGAKLYVKHPDQKSVWPDNKGLLTRKWPSPFH